MNSVSRSTLLGGLGFALVGLLQLVPIVLNWLSIAYDAQSVFRSGPAQVLQFVVLLASCVILAFGGRGESGIAGPTVAGRLSVLSVGLVGLIQLIVSFAFPPQLVGTTAGVWLGTAIGWLPVAAFAFAGVMVARARVLDGIARVALLAVAASLALYFLLGMLVVAWAPLAVPVLFVVAALPPLLLALTGVSYAVHGRSAAIRHRLETIYAAW